MSASLAAALREAGDPHLPLAEAVEAGRMGMLASDAPEDWLAPAALHRLKPPYLVVMVANDPPVRTRSATSVRRWARAAVVHASDERPGDYQSIPGLTERHRRLLLVETIPAVADAWVGFLQRSIPNVWVLR